MGRGVRVRVVDRIVVDSGQKQEEVKWIKDRGGGIGDTR